MSSSACFNGSVAHGILLGIAGALTLACSNSVPNGSAPDAGPPSNHALKFNGTTDYAQAGTANFVAAISPQTISLWVWYAESDAGGANPQDFVSLQKDTESGLHVGIKGGQVAAWREYERSTDPPLVDFTLPSAGWHHVAYVLDIDPVNDGLVNTLYVDGKVVDTTALIPNNLTPELMVLGSSAQYQNFFAGYLDEIRIWNVARTGPEVIQEMNGNVGSEEPGLVAYFNCNEIVDGGLLPDNSGNGNNGLLGGGDPEDMPTLVPSNRPQPGQ